MYPQGALRCARAQRMRSRPTPTPSMPPAIGAAISIFFSTTPSTAACRARPAHADRQACTLCLPCVSRSHCARTYAFRARSSPTSATPYGSLTSSTPTTTTLTPAMRGYPDARIAACPASPFRPPYPSHGRTLHHACPARRLFKSKAFCAHPASPQPLPDSTTAHKSSTCALHAPPPIKTACLPARPCSYLPPAPRVAYGAVRDTTLFSMGFFSAQTRRRIRPNAHHASVTRSFHALFVRQAPSRRTAHPAPSFSAPPAPIRHCASAARRRRLRRASHARRTS